MPMYEKMGNCKFCNKDIEYYFSDFTKESDHAKGDTYDFCINVDSENSLIEVLYQNPVSDGSLEIPIRYCPMCGKDLNPKRKYQNGVYHYIDACELAKCYYDTDRFIFVKQCRVETWSEKSNRYGILINTKEKSKLGHMGIMKWVDESKIIDDEELDSLEKDGVLVEYV